MNDLRTRLTIKGSYKLPIAGALLVGAASAAIAITAPAAQNAQGISGAQQVAGHSPQRAMPTPFSASARLAKLDELHAQVEEAKLRAALAKANSDAQAPGGAGSTMLAPPLPTSPSSTNLLTPPLPTSDVGPARDAGATRQPSAPRYALIEAWGAGTSRQAIIGSSSGSSRLVHVGDRITGGTITDINSNSVTYKDSRGKRHVID